MTEPSSLKVRNTAGAVEVTVDYLQKWADLHPSPGTAWQEKKLFAAGIEDYRVTGRLYFTDDWLIEVNQNVAPLSKTVYEITVFSPKLHRYWQGSVRADGGVTEAVTFKELTAAESRKLADEYEARGRIEPPRPGGYGH